MEDHQRISIPFNHLQELICTVFKVEKSKYLNFLLLQLFIQHLYQYQLRQLCQISLYQIQPHRFFFYLHSNLNNQHWDKNLHIYLLIGVYLGKSSIHARFLLGQLKQHVFHQMKIWLLSHQKDEQETNLSYLYFIWATIVRSAD